MTLCVHVDTLSTVTNTWTLCVHSNQHKDTLGHFNFSLSLSLNLTLDLSKTFAERKSKSKAT